MINVKNTASVENIFDQAAICLLDSWALRRRELAKSLGRAGYAALELGSPEEFMNFDLPFSLLILAQNGRGWNDLRMLCLAANVPIIVLVADEQWASLSWSAKLEASRNPISVSHIDTDEIVWRIEALLLRAAMPAQAKAQRQQFSRGNDRCINGAHCIDLVRAHR